MSRLGLLFFRLLLLLGALAFLALFAARQLAVLMGATTIADGYRLLVEQAPDWAQRLFTAPWWVPAAAAALLLLLLIWPARARRRAAPPPVEPAPAQAEAAGKAEPTAFERVRKAPPAPYLKDQHIYAGSAKLSMVPEFRAIPVRYISHGKIFVEYNAYSTEAHRWEPRRRILVAELRDQEAGDWSVINVELMTFYENESGGLTWRWAREFDYGAPTDEDYLFAIADHYQGRVVFVGPDDTIQRSYFAIMPSKDFPSDMPNLISLGIFDFVEEWETQDREEVLTL